MTIYQWGEDDMFDLQRMPRKTGSDGSADDPSPQHLQRIYGENLLPVVLMEDPIFHTDDHPFCPDWSCTCHEEDQEAIARVAQWVKDGLLTPDEATQYILGRTFAEEERSRPYGTNPYTGENANENPPSPPLS